MLLSVDPSILSAGVALFADGELIGAGCVRASKMAATMPIGARALVMAQEILRWSIAHNAQLTTLAFEWPQVYRAAKSKGDPNDLIALAGVGMAVAGIVSMGLAGQRKDLQVLSPTPAQWAGQLPKSKTLAIKSPRASRILARLSRDEIAHVPSQHDAIDAIGIGLWALGRLAPARVFPGASD